MHRNPGRHGQRDCEFAYAHDVDRLFAEARERQKHSGHPVVNLQTKRRKT
jgi:hypothetical protein